MCNIYKEKHNRKKKKPQNTKDGLLPEGEKG